MDANPYKAPSAEASPDKSDWIPARIWRRGVASIIDTFIVLLGLFVLSAIPWNLARPISDPTDEPSPDVVFSSPLFLAPKWLWLIPCIAITTPLAYHTMFIWQRGATIGKHIMGIQILQLSGYGVTLQQAVTRFVFSWIGGVLLGIGYLTVFFTRHHRALHDLIAGTVAADSCIPSRSTESDVAGAD